jgi:hypothetical protein
MGRECARSATPVSAAVFWVQYCAVLFDIHSNKSNNNFECRASDEWISRNEQLLITHSNNTWAE